MPFTIDSSGFKQPDLTAKSPAFWYLVANSKTKASMCTIRGAALISSYQKVLSDALKPPWKGITEQPWPDRVAVDGYIGPETIEATWAYLRLQGWPETSPVKPVLSSMLSSQKPTPGFALIALTSAFYLPRYTVDDKGKKTTLAPRISRDYVPTEFVFQSEKFPGSEAGGVFVSANTKMWPWMQPLPAGSPSAAELMAEMPQCKQVTAAAPAAKPPSTSRTTSTVKPPAYVIPPPPARNSGGGSGMMLLGAAGIAAYFLLKENK